MSSRVKNKTELESKVLLEDMLSAGSGIRLRISGWHHTGVFNVYYRIKFFFKKIIIMKNDDI
jgi:hypothetical protein